MPPQLFSPMTMRSLMVPGRAWVSPMCQYSCRPSEPGFVTDWHLAHLMAFAVGGAPLVMTEATAVTREGRISPWDTGVWEDQHGRGWRRIVDQVHQVGARIGMQLAHAGRKASTYAPFHDRQGSVRAEEGGWRGVAPNARAFGDLLPPRGLSTEEVAAIPAAFGRGARRAVAAGFDLVEIHAAHGYLLHQFLSPTVNDRGDVYGGDDAGRARLLLEVLDAVRAAVPDRLPVTVRLSATEWTTPEGDGDVEADLERTVALAQDLAARGVDLIDVSSGGIHAAPVIPVGPGYQTRFAQAVRSAVDIPVSTVGMITSARQAEHVLATGQADVVMLGRAALADPRWWHRAAYALGHELAWVPQYARVSDQHVY